MDKTYTNSRRKGRQSSSSTEGSLTSSPVNKKHKFSKSVYSENNKIFTALNMVEDIAKNLKLVFEKLEKLG